jgi:hypothetical protein
MEPNYLMAPGEQLIHALMQLEPWPGRFGMERIL